MGASSVTGTGIGSAYKSNDLSRASLSITNLVGPKIVAAGIEKINGTSATIKFPSPSGDFTDYAIFLTSNDKGCPYISKEISPVPQSHDWTFTISSSNNSVVNWMMVKIGIA